MIIVKYSQKILLDFIYFVNVEHLQKGGPLILYYL